MDLLEKCALRLELFQGSPQSISLVVTKTGGTLETLMEFFQWMYDDASKEFRAHVDADMLFPLLLQGDSDVATIYQDQPVVWDGTFYLSDEGELMYKGYAKVSGFGGETERIVKVTDQIMVG